MAKLTKITSRMLAISIDMLLIFLICFAFLIRTTPVQTFLAQKATSFLSEELRAKISVEELAIVFVDRVALLGVEIQDQNADTLASLGTLYVNLRGFDLFQGIWEIESLILEEGHVHLNREPQNGIFNYQFLIDYFTPEEPTTEPQKLELAVDKIELNNIHFKYDDLRKERTDFGIDWNHLNMSNVQLKVRSFSAENNVFQGKIKHLSTQDHSGFDLHNLVGDFTLSSKGLNVQNLQVSTPQTDLDLPKFALEMNQLSDFNTFEDSVRFNCKMNASTVSMLDISYFAPALEGMNQLVDIKTKLTGKTKSLYFTELKLSTGEKTTIEGDIFVPDFANIENEIFEENIKYAYIYVPDIEAIRLPKNSKTAQLDLGKEMKNLKFFELDKVHMHGGINSFDFEGKTIETELGVVEVNNKVFFTKKSDSLYHFQSGKYNQKDIKIQEFALGEMLEDSVLGDITAELSIKGRTDFSSIILDSVYGDIYSFTLDQYTYQNISIQNASLENSIIEAQLAINDENVQLTYDGSIGFEEELNAKVEVDITALDLNKIGYYSRDSSNLTTKFRAELSGQTLNSLRGKAQFEALTFVQNQDTIDLPSLNTQISRSPTLDNLALQSDWIDISIEGKIDLNKMMVSIQNNVNTVLPSLIGAVNPNQPKTPAKGYIKFNVLAKNVHPITELFLPELKIDSGTTVSGYYDGNNNAWSTNVSSPQITWSEMSAQGLAMNQQFDGVNANLKLTSDRFQLNDSVSVQQFNLYSSGTNNRIRTDVKWNEALANESYLNWDTYFPTGDEVDFFVHPSFVTIKNKRWDILRESEIDWSEGKLVVKDFRFERDDQYISVNGIVAKNQLDKIKIKVSHIQLADFSDVLPNPMALEGELNAYALITDPFENIQYSGDASIQQFVINDERVGDVFVQSNWNRKSKKIQLNGDLNYLDQETFSFAGYYLPFEDKNSLNVDFKFDNTNIAFTNAFLDPQVVSGIEGRLNGKLSVKGTPSAPRLKGEIKMTDAEANIGILGTTFKTTGTIEINEEEFFMNNLPLSDNEGNTGSMNGSILHKNFTDWNFDVGINLEDDYYRRDPNIGWKKARLNKFLVMNTEYVDGSTLYYGKAYLTGTANISGQADNLDITTDLKTEKGTNIYFPMYGSSDIEGEDDFIEFLNKDTTLQIEEQKIDFTGVSLDLNFDITTDAKIKLIFDENVGDAITTDGSGMITMRVNNLGDLTLNGTYIVNEGVYNFALGPVKENFYLEKGGSISWTGDPYNANLNLRSYLKVNADLAELSSDQLGQSSSSQEIFCYLNITQTLNKPAIGFDIKAPRASESGKALLNRVKSDPDELNRQFFSLLLSKRFSPLQGNNTAGGGAVLDLASNQINSVLSQLSNTYEMAVNMDANSLTGDRSFEFDVSREFLNNRLILKGSFGVANSSNQTAAEAQSNLIGDVNLEYLLNPAGTFRVNIFNESNQNNVLQDNNQGMFKQGVGVNYQEDFNGVSDFKMIQYFLDLFRKKEDKRYPTKRKSSMERVPALKPEED